MGFVRLLIYVWTLPTTAVGLVFLPAAVCTGGRARWVDGVLEVHGGLLRWMLRHCTVLSDGVSAITFGHVVLAQDRWLLDATRSHERIHVRQAERWGPLFIPAYLSASLIALLRGQRPYRDNVFEREAYDNAR